VTLRYFAPERGAFVRDAALGWPEGESPRPGMISLVITVDSTSSGTKASDTIATFDVGRHDDAVVLMLYVSELRPRETAPDKPRLTAAALVAAPQTWPSVGSRTSVAAEREANGTIQVTIRHRAPRGGAFVRNLVVGWPEGEAPRDSIVAVAVEAGAARSTRDISTAQETFDIGRHDGAVVVIVYVREFSASDRPLSEQPVQACAALIVQASAPQ
jgi:hypothetical protein